MKTLVYDPFNSEILELLSNDEEIDVKFSIHSLKGVKKDLDSQEIIKFNIPSNTKFEISEESQKYYIDFYNKHFTKFSYQFMRRGLKTLDIHEIRNHFANIFHNFFNILKKNQIELTIIFHLPHEGPDYMMYEISRLLKIKTILMYQSIFPNKYFMLNNYEKLGEIGNLDIIEKNRSKNFDFENFINLYRETTKKYQDFKLVQRDKKKINKRFFKSIIIKFLVKLKLIKGNYQFQIEEKYKQNLNKIEIKGDKLNKIVNGKKVIFFPLHMQPELSTSLLGGQFEDQILALEKLNSFAKNDWVIIAKEARLQTSYQRNDFFFKRVSALKNVFFIDKSEDSQKLLELSDITATVTGTIGFESLLISKKCLIFGHAWYKKIHGSLFISDKTTNSEIDSFIKTKFDKSKFMNNLYSVILTCYDGVVSYDSDWEFHKNMVNNFDDRKNCEKVLENIKQFIESNYK